MAKINKRDLYYIIGIAIVVIIIVLGDVFWQKQGSDSDNFNLQQQSQNKSDKPAESDAVKNQKSGEASNLSGSVSGVTPSLSYQEAVMFYRDRRFQFSFAPTVGCNMNPYQYVFKNGVSVMLDNRSDKNLTIDADGISYGVSAYSYKIVTLISPTQLPHTVNISCEPGKNSGQIILQQ